MLVTVKRKESGIVFGSFPLAAAVVAAPSLVACRDSAGALVEDDFSCGSCARFFAVAVLSSRVVVDSLAFKARHGGTV